MASEVLTFFPDHPDAGDFFSTKCSSAEDKYKLLDSRDKVLRARVPKVKVRVEFATKLFGTCRDMCPERERYMRQVQRQLTAFETVDDSYELAVDHTRAVKAYSRSSADQDEPLPHELRPVETLEMTMNYLLHNIVPMPEKNEELFGDWYNFLWDRTRSIRKDITQQQLADLKVVGLLEKCARFHIHCSSRLCELDVHTFDPKLNDENLMKCLQSLEHMYEDLRRRGIQCPNEPEFRAYQVMMNLNEGDILLEIQQMPEWILKSGEVQAAIRIHHSVFLKNYATFFRLVKSFPYMFSCILHRYFYQVRSRALVTICKTGAASRKSDVQLKCSQVQRMLGFGEDSGNQLFEMFCTSHGLLPDWELDRLFYKPRQFCRPDFSISREPFLIESKLTTSTAEAINGGPLPPNPAFTYVPQTSFDEAGFLIPGSIAGEDMPDGKPLPFRPISITVKSTPFLPSRKLEAISGPFPMKVVPSSSFSISRASTGSPPLHVHSPFSNFRPVGYGSPGSFKSDSSQGPPFGLPSLLNSSTPFAFHGKPTVVLSAENEMKKKRLTKIEQVCGTVFDDLVTQFVSDELEESVQAAMEHSVHERTLQEKLRQKDAIRTRNCEQAAEEFLDHVVPCAIRQVAREELQFHRRLQRDCEEYFDNSIDQVLYSVMRPICAEVLSHHQAEHERMMRKAATIFSRLKLRFAIQTWKKFVLRRKLIRKKKEEKLLETMINFPAVNPIGKSPKEVLQQLCGSSNSNSRQPNINKFTSRTAHILDRYEKAESLAESFRQNVNAFVVGIHNKSLEANSPTPPQTPQVNEDYYRYSWKRKWSIVKDDMDTDITSFNGRKSKSPRQEFALSSSSTSTSLNGGKETPSSSSISPSSGSTRSSEPAGSLLDAIRKFAEETRKEKEQLRKSEAMITTLSKVSDEEEQLIPGSS